MINHLTATLVIDARDNIGEAPAWDAVRQRFLWTDNAVGVVHEARSDGANGWHESQRWNLNRPIGAAIPRTKGGLVVVGGIDIFILNEAGDITPFARLDADPGQTSLNDAKCDSQGRLWVGALATDYTSAGIGALYRVDPNGTVTRMLKDVTISNGLDWSPDGSTLYYIDSHTRSIAAFDFDALRGSISNRREVVTIEWGAGLPDGMIVDREGCLWVAVIGAGEIRRYAPDGVLLTRVEVSAPAVTSCAFGGRDGADLFITSAAVRLPDAALSYGISSDVIEKSPTAPGAGGVFVCRPGTTGRPAMPFAG